MPWHIHPALRSLEQAEQSAGIIEALNSNGYTVLVAEEAAVKKPAPKLPVGIGYIIKGVKYAHSS